MVGRPERRLVSRRAPSESDPLRQVRLRGGREGHVIDLSSLGALLEGSARLLPGTEVEVQVSTVNGRVVVRSRVVRSCVSGLSAEQVSYRGAIRFERAIDVTPRG
jgi:hypothetical protein